MVRGAAGDSMRPSISRVPWTGGAVKKVPDVSGTWAVEFIDEVPKTSVGKFSKKTLREKFSGYALPS